MRQTKSLLLISAPALYSGSLQVAASPCWEMALPDVISACPSLDARTCTAAEPQGALPASSPATSALPESTERVGFRFGPLSDFTAGPHFAAVVIPIVPASRFARHPGRSHRCGSMSTGRPWLLLPSRTYVVTFICIGYASRPRRAIDGRGLPPHKTRSLVGCSVLRGGII